MGRVSSTSVVLPSECRPWFEVLEAYGYRARIVVAFERHHRIRVSVTLSRPDDAGVQKEAYREGETIEDRQPNGIEKAALRAAARLCGRLDAIHHAPVRDEYAQLPLPLD